MKKAAPILVALALVAVGGISFYLGQQSAPAEPEQVQPAASTVEEAQPQELVNQVKEEKVNPVEYTEEQLYELYEDIYQRVESRKNDLKLFHLEDRINFEIQASGKRIYGSVEKTPSDHADRYLAWRNEYHPDNEDSKISNDSQDTTTSEVTKPATTQKPVAALEDAEAIVGTDKDPNLVYNEEEDAYYHKDNPTDSVYYQESTDIDSPESDIEVTVITDMGFTSPEMENGHVGGIDTSNLEIIG